MIIKQMTTEKIKKEMKIIKTKCHADYEWVHKNKRYSALFNEYERRLR